MLSEERVKRNRDTLGQTLKAGREKSGYTQKALADAIGIEYYTMISQMELGYISIPPTLWIPIAHELKFDTHAWVLQCLSEYQPDVFEALFGKKSMKEITTALISLHQH